MGSEAERPSSGRVRGNARSWLRVFLAVAFLGLGASLRAQYTIRWVSDPATTAVEVDGIPRDAIEALQAAEPGSVPWVQLLAVYAEQPMVPGAPMPPMPAMAGTWKIVRGKLRFEPRFPFARGVAYRAEFWPMRLPGPLGAPAQLLGPIVTGGYGTPQGPVISFYELPREKGAAATTVMQIYPSADILPENQLKFYVHFSGPMSRGGIHEHVELRDQDNRPVELPFLELDEELWDRGMTRLTLLVDPGRIKRGVKPLEDIGPVFEPGKSYTLAIKASWKDANGRPLQRNFEKAFRVGPADRTPPDPQRWRLQYLPPPGTQAPLIVLFDEPMDRALALRLIGVRRVNADGSEGAAVDGEVVLDEQERRWMIQPAKPWPAGAYRLVVGSTIEDLAGNNIGKTFDVEVASGAPRQAAAATVHVPFEVR
jgi:hypothetical protein